MEHKGTVLIVEDDEATAALLGDVLADKGYELLQAREGGEALRLLREQQPSVIILDLALPGIDGRSFLMDLRSNEATKRTPVIIVSANSETLSSFERRAVARVVTKPFDVAELVSIVDSVTAGAASPAGNPSPA